MRYGDGPVDVLLVEDRPGDLRLTKEAFNRNGLVKLQHASFWSVGLALAWLITSPAQAHSRGFAWFFAHSRPQGTCAGQHVVATFYASGRRTASGQTFDPSGYTAAHRSLPFGSRVTVTNPQNGNSVTVVINDRGPFTRGVTLDLSPGAARAIGMHRTQWLCML